MKINREILARAILEAPTLEGMVGRCTGRTTILALRYIANAIENPGVSFALCDHAEGYQPQRHLQFRVMQMIEQMGLRDFTVDRGRLTCSFATRIS